MSRRGGLDSVATVLDRSRMSLPTPGTRALISDGALVGLVVVLALVGPLDEPDGPPRWQWLLAVALTATALLMRRRSALLATAGVLLAWAVAYAPAAADDPPFQFIAMLIAAYALGAHEDRTRGLLGLAALSVVFVVMNITRGLETADALVGPVAFATVYGFAAALSRGRRRSADLEAHAARLAAERDERAREAVAAERAHIARDMHDALGHAISVMTLQIGAVRTRLAPDQEPERRTLLEAERTGRDSVAELRRMLGILRDEPRELRPPAGLNGLDATVENVRAAGVSLDVDVDPSAAALPPGVDAAAFRIAQEALTNVVRHAPQAHASVRIARHADAVLIEVTDDGGGRAPAAPGEPGHGITGMRERVNMYDGSLVAGATPAGGWTVTARLPLARDERA